MIFDFLRRWEGNLVLPSNLLFWILSGTDGDKTERPTKIPHGKPSERPSKEQSVGPSKRSSGETPEGKDGAKPSRKLLHSFHPKLLYVAISHMVTFRTW